MHSMLQHCGVERILMDQPVLQRVEAAIIEPFAVPSDLRKCAPFVISEAGNGYPAILAHGLTRLCMHLLEPRDDNRRLRLELPPLNIVVWQRTVERILTRHERDRDVIMAG